ncbi:hypothetical protein AMELA_G00090950 [Ameiurus melas]|uniref:Homeobox protein D4 n=1 Tax=Ameiurus melas TaxID=219545 RepID=A0A7J6AWD3_AMEME|nr:hypothetical protein AMELA_G00090950 [Ameiurus melas]
MAMSSYMVNSKYVEPKFPPCEEYSQNSYIPEQGSGYYSPSQDTDFQHPGIYSRSNYSEQPYSCNTVQGSTVQPRGHVQEQGSHPGSFPTQGEQCSPIQISGPRTCDQQQNTKNQNGIQTRQPAIVYPWMKKVHVSTVNPDFTGPEPKRSRTAYTRQQVLELEKEFHFNSTFVQHFNQWKLGRGPNNEKRLRENRKQCNKGYDQRSKNRWEVPIT